MANDFSQTHPPLDRLPLYRLCVDLDAQAAALSAFQAHRITNILITSAQIAAWAGAKAPHFIGAAALSPAWGKAAQQHLPHLRQVWTVPDLESGVRVLSESPF